MSVVSEAVGRRVTLGYLADRYGLELDPAFAGGVTVTSMADDIESVRPGGLYAPLHDADLKNLGEARARGAYAALVPSRQLAQSEGDADGEPGRGNDTNPQIPMLVGDLDDKLVGRIAADLAGAPANALAVFAVSDADQERCERRAAAAADFLHILGNPVGLISASGSTSLERDLDVTYPLDILDVQQVLSVCVEDGAAAIVFALDSRTLAPHALSGVNVDVIGMDAIARNDAHDSSNASLASAGQAHSGIAEDGSHPVDATSHTDAASGASSAGSDGERTEVIPKHESRTPDAADAITSNITDSSRAPTVSLPKLGAGVLLSSLHDGRRDQAARLAGDYGFIIDGQTHVTARDAQSDMLASQAPAMAGNERSAELSLSIAMAMAAGVRKSNIRSALRVSHELNTQEEHNA